MYRTVKSSTNRGAGWDLDFPTDKLSTWLALHEVKNILASIYIYIIEWDELFSGLLMNCKSGEVEEGGVGLVAGDKAGDDDFPPYVSHISSTTPPWPSSATAVALPNYSSRSVSTLSFLFQAAELLCLIPWNLCLGFSRNPHACMQCTHSRVRATNHGRGRGHGGLLLSATANSMSILITFGKRE